MRPPWAPVPRKTPRKTRIGGSPDILQSVSRPNEATRADREAPLPADSDPTESAPAVIVLAGRYRILALLGLGGMGSVYLAEDIELGEKVAVKMLRTDAKNTAFIDRLKSEVRLARRVTHPNVARMYDIGEHKGERFLTMEYVEGESLGARLARDGALDASSFFRVAKDLTLGLATAHAAGVVHRDLKPHNILLCKDGRAVITDFGTAGLAGAEAEGLVLGTPSFMAPEQFEARFDLRSDIFGLGAIFYSALTGKKPFTGPPRDRPARPPNPRDLRPGLSPELGELVARCLEPSPEDRFPGAESLETALECARMSFEEGDVPPNTIPNSAVTNVVRAMQLDPRQVLLHAAADTEDRSFAQGLRDEVADRINDHAAIRALSDEKRGHEARAEVAVRRDGDTLVLDVRVVGAREEFEFWRGSFEGSASDAIDLARAAAGGIERALGVVAQRTATIPPLGKEAASLYLAGRSTFRELWPESVRGAVASFEQALALAPDHPLLLAALAVARTRLAFFDEDLLEDAREAGERAVLLAPDLAEAHFARGMLLLQNTDVEPAVGALLRALALAPGHVEALPALADVALELGAPADAIRLSEGELLRDPLYDLPWTRIARAHALLGRWEQAASAVDRVTSPSARTLAAGLACRFGTWRRDRPAILAALNRLGEIGADRDTPHYGIMFWVGESALAGRSLRGNDTYQRAKLSRSATRRRRAFIFQLDAESDAYVEDYDHALASIQAAVAEGLFDTFWLERCPLFDDMRGSARFEKARHTVLERARPALARLHAPV
jgi:serine/threonine protein kinase/tetratricopeptide (TPR) repeat protein